MRAALVTDHTHAPEVTDLPDPGPRDGYVPVTMLAAGVHQIVRSTASGRHYGAPETLPFVPGIDGVGRLPDGTVAYVGGAPHPHGTIAERTLVRDGAVVPLPAGLDPVTAAAIVNPGISSMVPLTGIADLRPGGTVVVLGATGTSGRIAVQTARLLGAGRVVAVGRSVAGLVHAEEAGASTTVRLTGDRDDDAAAIRTAMDGSVDVVLDYLWGPVAETMFEVLTVRGLQGRTGRGVHYVQIGALAGATAAVPAAVLRASSIAVSGSGAGSVSFAAILAAVPRVLQAAADGLLTVDAVRCPLEELPARWDSGERLVVTM